MHEAMKQSLARQEIFTSIFGIFASNENCHTIHMILLYNLRPKFFHNNITTWGHVLKWNDHENSLAPILVLQSPTCAYISPLYGGNDHYPQQQSTERL